MFKSHKANCATALIIFISLFILAAFANGVNTNDSESVVLGKGKLKCVDGDTFALGKTYYRLSYIDTPEHNESGFQEASDYTCRFLKDNSPVGLKTHGKDKYGRTLVEVVGKTGDLNKLLIKKCLAEPFYGKTNDWTLSEYKTLCQKT